MKIDGLTTGSGDCDGMSTDNGDVDGITTGNDDANGITTGNGDSVVITVGNVDFDKSAGIEISDGNDISPFSVKITVSSKDRTSLA